MIAHQSLGFLYMLITKEKLPVEVAEINGV